MGLLRGLLAAAAGQLQLSSPLGKFHEAVAQNVEDKVLMPPLFVQTGQSASPTFDLTGSFQDLHLDTLLEDGGISYEPSTGLYSLAAGKLYLLHFYGEWTITAPASALEVAWFDEFDNRLTSYPTTAPGGLARFKREDPVVLSTTQPTAVSIFRATELTRVKLRMRLDAISTAQIGTASHAMIHEIK